MCIHLLHHQPTPADAQPIQDPSTSTNIHKPTPTLVSSRVVDFFGTPHLVCPARLYGLQCVKNVLRINSDLQQKKGLSVGTFGGSGLQPLPPLCDSPWVLQPTVLWGRRVTLGSYGERGTRRLRFFQGDILCRPKFG